MCISTFDRLGVNNLGLQRSTSILVFVSHVDSVSTLHNTLLLSDRPVVAALMLKAASLKNSAALRRKMISFCQEVIRHLVSAALRVRDELRDGICACSSSGHRPVIEAHCGSYDNFSFASVHYISRLV